MFCHVKLMWISLRRRLPCAGDSSPAWQRWVHEWVHEPLQRAVAGVTCGAGIWCGGVNWGRLRWLIALFEVKTHDRVACVTAQIFWGKNPSVAGVERRRGRQQAGVCCTGGCVGTRLNGKVKERHSVRLRVCFCMCWAGEVAECRGK